MAVHGDSVKGRRSADSPTERSLIKFEWSDDGHCRQKVPIDHEGVKFSGSWPEGVGRSRQGENSGGGNDPHALSGFSRGFEKTCVDVHAVMELGPPIAPEKCPNAGGIYIERRQV